MISKLAKFIVLFFGVAIILAMLFGDYSTTGTSGSNTATGTAPAPQKSPGEVRRDKLERQFSAWDGSHIKLERSVKKSLNDPKSYEHIESRFSDDGDRITVILRFRAKNAFGGYVARSARGVYNIDGQELEQPVLLD